MQLRAAYAIGQMSEGGQKPQLKHLDASTIVLGFTGPIGSGCSYIAEAIPRIRANYRYYRLSDVIRDVLKEEGNDNPSIAQLQDKGNELRRTKGNRHLILTLLDKIERDGSPKADGGIIIDGIKNEEEVLVLRTWPNFLLFSVQADRELRLRRVVRSKKMKENEFKEADSRDEMEPLEHGQQVKRCNYLSDVIVVNDHDFASASRMAFVSDVYKAYVKLVENIVNDISSPDIAPSVHELCMTIAYALSKSSSCLKRKVGALVVELDHTTNGKKRSAAKHLVMPSIVSSGYNEVPLGSYKCIFNPDYGMCYRCHLQEEFAGNLKRCPNCGSEIKVHGQCLACGEEYNSFIKTCRKCHREIEIDYECPTATCKTRVFDTFIPGSKKSPGKLLDMCRALHAEETALLNLRRRGSRPSDNLVLYTTTQPCNLCSNKIVAAGIKKVIFDEPYPMKEALDILKSGNVEFERFQGIKSSAYFRLYQ